MEICCGGRIDDLEYFQKNKINVKEVYKKFNIIEAWECHIYVIALKFLLS